MRAAATGPVKTERITVSKEPKGTQLRTVRGIWDHVNKSERTYYKSAGDPRVRGVFGSTGTPAVSPGTHQSCHPELIMCSLS
jgi:hypothetical protein